MPQPSEGRVLGLEQYVSDGYTIVLTHDFQEWGYMMTRLAPSQLTISHQN